MNTQTATPTTASGLLPSLYVEEIKDYPFGRHRTTGKAWLEFSPRHGFRFCRQLVNPKTGRYCAPKKSTYFECALPMRKENGHFSFAAWDLNKTTEEIEAQFAEIANVWNLWSQDQQKFILSYALLVTKAKVRVAYEYQGLNPGNGIELKEILPIYEPIVKKLYEGIKGQDPEPFKNCAPNLELYRELLAKVPANYSPFKVTHYRHNLHTGQMEQITEQEANQ